MQYKSRHVSMVPAFVVFFVYDEGCIRGLFATEVGGDFAPLFGVPFYDTVGVCVGF